MQNQLILRWQIFKKMKFKQAITRTSIENYSKQKATKLALIDIYSISWTEFVIWGMLPCGLKFQQL